MTVYPQTPRARDPRGGWIASLAAALMTGALLLLLAYTQSFHFLPLAALWQPLGIALTVAAGLWLGARLLTRAPAVAGVVAVALLLFNHTLHAPLFGWLQYAMRWPAPLDSWRLLPVLLASLPGVALLAWGFWLGRRRPAWCAALLRPLNLFLAANLLFAASRLAVLEWRRPHADALFPPLVLHTAPTPPPETLPTIVHLVLDGCASDEILATRYGTGDEPLTGSLKAQGFHVVPRARSNYIQTALSLAATLNLDYLSIPPNLLGEYDRTPLLRQIQSSRVVDVLRAAGYEIVNFPSGYDFTDEIGADVRVAPRFFNELAANQWERSWIGTLAGGGRGEAANHVRRIETVFRELPGLCARSARPRYIFAHVVAPHPPFLFDEQGPRRDPVAFDLMDGSHRVGPGGAAQAAYRAAYLAQLRYIAAATEDVMRRLLATASRPLVILLHADHGPGSGLWWESREASDVGERLGILCALRFPGGDYADIPDDLSPVNLFRIVFNRHLGTRYPLLPNQSYFTRWRRPYRCEPVDFQTEPSDWSD